MQPNTDRSIPFDQLVGLSTDPTFRDDGSPDPNAYRHYDSSSSSSFSNVPDEQPVPEAQHQPPVRTEFSIWRMITQCIPFLPSWETLESHVPYVFSGKAASATRECFVLNWHYMLLSTVFMALAVILLRVGRVHTEKNALANSIQLRYVIVPDPIDMKDYVQQYVTWMRTDTILTITIDPDVQRRLDNLYATNGQILLDSPANHMNFQVPDTPVFADDNDNGIDDAIDLAMQLTMLRGLDPNGLSTSLAMAANSDIRPVAKTAHDMEREYPPTYAAAHLLGSSFIQFDRTVHQFKIRHGSYDAVFDQLEEQFNPKRRALAVQDAKDRGKIPTLAALKNLGVFNKRVDASDREADTKCICNHHVQIADFFAYYIGPDTSASARAGDTVSEMFIDPQIFAPSPHLDKGLKLDGFHYSSSAVGSIDKMLFTEGGCDPIVERPNYISVSYYRIPTHAELKPYYGDENYDEIIPAVYRAEAEIEQRRRYIEAGYDARYLSGKDIKSASATANRGWINDYFFRKVLAWMSSDDPAVIEEKKKNDAYYNVTFTRSVIDKSIQQARNKATDENWALRRIFSVAGERKTHPQLVATTKLDITGTQASCIAHCFALDRCLNSRRNEYMYRTLYAQENVQTDPDSWKAAPIKYRMGRN